MGGTRLVEEFAEEASSAGYTVVWGRCTPPWSTSRAVSALGPLLDVQARLGVAEAESKAPTGPPTRGRRNAVRLAQWAAAEVSVHRIARAMDYGPVVCVLEDLHWASRELLRAVGSLASLCSDLPCVLLRTMHEPEAPSTVVLSGHLAQLGAVQLTLGPLSTADVRTALAARGETDDPNLAGELRRRTDGSPFLLTEVLKLPREQWVGPTSHRPPGRGTRLRGPVVRMPARLSVLLREAAAEAGLLSPSGELRLGVLACEVLLSSPSYTRNRWATQLAIKGVRRVVA